MEQSNDLEIGNGEEEKEKALIARKTDLAIYAKQYLEQCLISLNDSRPVALTTILDAYMVSGKYTSTLLQELSRSLSNVSNRPNCDTVSHVIHLTFSMANFLLQAKELTRSSSGFKAANLLREKILITGKATKDLAVQVLEKQITGGEIKVLAEKVMDSLRAMDSIVVVAQPVSAPPPPPLPNF